MASAAKTNIGKMFQPSKDDGSEGTNCFYCCCAIVTGMIVVSLLVLIQSQMFRLETKTSTENIIPEVPSMIPSLSPTQAPTNLRKQDRTYPPTIITQSPTTVPSQTPITQPPTIVPSSAPTGIPREDAIKSLVETITPPSVIADLSSAQYKALNWIVTYDPLQLSENDPNLLQRYILATLYFSTRGDMWRLCARDTEEDTCENGNSYRFLSGVGECNWYGLRCNNVFDKKVQSINLENNRLRGIMPPEISSLQKLVELNLSYNSINGEVQWPPTSTQIILLNNNNLFGNVPGNLNTLTNLVSLSLGNNKMTGVLPPDMFPLSLENIDLEGNSFSGTIPEEIFSCKNLAQVDLNTNQFAGTINPKWGNLEKLILLNLQTNNFTGTLPGSLFTQSLAAISLGINQLVGTIPDQLFSSTSLEYLDLGGNQFNGTISTQFGDLKKMKYLTIWLNTFTGTIPKEIGNMPLLEMFQAPYNYLTGEVPKEICDATPNPLAVLSTDCLSPEEGIPPRVKCVCCNSCLLGYKS